MVRVDFHCHTRASKDSLTSPEKLLETCRHKRIDRIVITDHNTIAGALEAQHIDPHRVIIGEEIKTLQGELLAVYVKEQVPAGLSASVTIAHLKDQGAFISVSHPFDRLRSGHWQLSDLTAILPDIDAIETYNSRCMWREANRMAQDFAFHNALPETVGSDAHVAFEIGSSYLQLPEFQDAPSLRAALRQATRVVSMSPLWVHWFSRFAVWKKIYSLSREKNATSL